MKNDNISSNYRSFSWIVSGWLGWLWLSLLLALGGMFSAAALMVGTFVLALTFTRQIRKMALAEHVSPPKYFFSVIRYTWRVALAVTILAVVYVLFAASPTVFSGRDQGSYSLAAVRLAQNHRLTFSTPESEAFFKIYGPGQALNFPGFAYTSQGQLVTQFPLGYISWLASTFLIFGLPGLAVANALTLTLFIIAFYLLLQLFIAKKHASIGAFLLITSFPVLWFAKYTLSENLAGALFAVLALQLTLFLKTERSFHFWLSLATAGFFAFTRIEGFAFLAATMLIVGLSQPGKQLWRKQRVTHFIMPALFFLLVLLADIFVNLPFYKNVAKGFLHAWQPLLQTSSGSVGSFFDSLLSLGNIFLGYGLLPAMLIGAFSIILFAKRKNFLILVPFALALPTFLYFLQPSISADHPWLLRRFAFSLWPTLLFFAVAGISTVDGLFKRRNDPSASVWQKHYGTLLFGVLFLVQLPAFIQYAAISEHTSLLKQTQSLSEPFSDTKLEKPAKLLLMSRLASGDAWAMLPDTLNTLFDTHAVYFFNPNDLDKLDLSRFDHVYLIASEEEIPFYTSNGNWNYTPVRPYAINTDHLTPGNVHAFPLELPSLQSLPTSGIIFEITRR